MIPFPHDYFALVNFIGMLFLLLLASLILSFLVFFFPRGKSATRKRVAKAILGFLSLPLFLFLAFLAIESRVRAARILREAEIRIPLDIVVGGELESAFQPPLHPDQLLRARESSFVAWGGSLLSNSKIDLILRAEDGKIDLPKVDLLVIDTNESIVRCLDISYGAIHSLGRISEFYWNVVHQIDTGKVEEEINASLSSLVPSEIQGGDSGTIRFPELSWRGFVVRPYLRGYCPESADGMSTGCPKDAARWDLRLTVASPERRVCEPYRRRG